MNKYKHLANSMDIKCKENGLHVRKEDICLIIKELDPRGVELRGTRCLHHLNLPDRVSREHGKLCLAHGQGNLSHAHEKVLRAHRIVSGAHHKLKDFFFFVHVPLGAP